GTDLQIQVVRPSRLKQKYSWPGYQRLSVDDDLTSIVQKAPTLTHTASKQLSDVTNLLFLGSREQLLAAFGAAGWFTADELSIRSAAKTVQATIRQANYANAPLSGLRIADRLPNLGFQ